MARNRGRIKVPKGSHGKDEPTMDDRPFDLPGKRLSAEFLQTAVELQYLVSAYGIDNTPRQPKTRAEFEAFYVKVHDGWKEAQRRIAKLLTERLSVRAEALAMERQARQSRDPEARKSAVQMMATVAIEIAFLRRTLDVVLWTILQGEHSTLRRLVVKGGQHSLSARNISDAMRAAEHLNRSPLVMALATDMLSLVHVGDLVHIDRGAGQVSFVELKAGEKNNEMAMLAEASLQIKCEHFDQFATAEMVDIDKKHFERVKRQAQRNHTIIETIRNEGGTDPNTGGKVLIHPTGEPTELWSKAIVSCYEQLSDQKNWAIQEIDDCLYLGVYNDLKHAFVGFQAWMHSIKCRSRIFNLTDCFRNPGVRPLGAMDLPLPLKEQILRGDIVVIMCLDIARMIELANRIQPGYMRLATRKETARMRQTLPHNDFALDRLLVRAGGETGPHTYLAEGFRDRILFDQHRPAQLLAQNIRGEAHLRKTLEREGALAKDSSDPATYGP